MGPYRTLLVDDERLALERLERLLAAHGEQVEVVGRARGGREALAAVERGRERLVAEAEGSADGRTKPATLPGTHTAVSRRPF